MIPDNSSYLRLTLLAMSKATAKAGCEWLRISNEQRIVGRSHINSPLRSGIILGIRELSKPNLSYRLGLLWIFLDPLFTAAVYGFLITVIRGNVDGWSVLIGVITLRAINGSVSKGVSSLMDSEPFPLIHTPTKPLIISRITSDGIQSFILGLTCALITMAITDAPASLPFHLSIVCITLSMLGLGIGLLVSPLTTVVKDVARIVKYILMFSFFLQAVIYEYSATSGLHKLVLSYLPHTMGVEWIRSIISGNPYPFELLHASKVLAFWTFISVIGFSKVDSTRWKASTWA